MPAPTITVEQGALLKLNSEEIEPVKALLTKKGMSWDCIDVHQRILKFPQQYVGYIGLPNRKVVIKPKHPGITISHILRVYYFMYSTENSDLDIPMYDVDSGNDINLVKMFLQELLTVVHKGLPVEYKEVTEEIPFVKGTINVVPTSLNIRTRKRDCFNCTYDDLSRDIPINRVLLAAVKKIELYLNNPDIAYIVRQFGNVNYGIVPDDITFSKNTAYCQKAVSLAYMILNDLTLSTEGESASGESLLINFDRVYEDFIKKILIEYSSLGKFSYWNAEKPYALCAFGDRNIERSYLPDLLYDYSEHNGRVKARAILDMKNKTSLPFHNPDVYQMAFYGQMLNCKKILLCYPSSKPQKNVALRFNDEQFFLQKIYAAFMNLAGNTAKEFKENIMAFVFNVECLL